MWIKLEVQPQGHGHGCGIHCPGRVSLRPEPRRQQWGSRDLSPQLWPSSDFPPVWTASFTPALICSGFFSVSPTASFLCPPSNLPSAGSLSPVWAQGPSNHKALVKGSVVRWGMGYQVRDGLSSKRLVGGWFVGGMSCWGDVLSGEGVGYQVGDGLVRGWAVKGGGLLERYVVRWGMGYQVGDGFGGEVYCQDTGMGYQLEAVLAFCPPSSPAALLPQHLSSPNPFRV